MTEDKQTLEGRLYYRGKIEIETSNEGETIAIMTLKIRDCTREFKEVTFNRVLLPDWRKNVQVIYEDSGRVVQVRDVKSGEEYLGVAYERKPRLEPNDTGCIDYNTGKVLW